MLLPLAPTSIILPVPMGMGTVPTPKSRNESHTGMPMAGASVELFHTHGPRRRTSSQGSSSCELTGVPFFSSTMSGLST